VTQLAKFNLRVYAKPAQADPVQKRRSKLLAAIDQQKLVLAVAIKGEAYKLPTKSDGKEPKPVRPWFMAQDGGYYVQCRYGARPLLLDAKNNAIFVNKLDEVGTVLAAFAAATAAGELDKPLAAVSERKKG
jgi:hypothetical protein